MLSKTPRNDHTSVSDGTVQLHRLLGMLLLQRSPRRYEELALALDIDALTVSQLIGELRRFGCVLDEHPQWGVQLIQTGLGCWSDYIQQRHVGRLGHHLLVYRRTASTQQVAHQLVDSPQSSDGRFAGFVVVADEQTAGRGRLGRRWLAESGRSLLLTVIVDRRQLQTDRLVLAGCVAVVEAVESMTEHRPAIKWPNDVMAMDRKLAGILVETVGPWALIGIGVNVQPMDHESWSSMGISLAELGGPIRRLLLLDCLLDQLDQTIYHLTDERLASYWRAHNYLDQQTLTVSSAGRLLRGRVVDISPTEGLMLALERGPVTVIPAATASVLDGRIDPAC